MAVYSGDGCFNPNVKVEKNKPMSRIEQLENQIKEISFFLNTVKGGGKERESAINKLNCLKAELLGRKEESKATAEAIIDIIQHKLEEKRIWQISDLIKEIKRIGGVE